MLAVTLVRCSDVGNQRERVTSRTTGELGEGGQHAAEHRSPEHDYLGSASWTERPSHRPIPESEPTDHPTLETALYGGRAAGFNHDRAGPRTQAEAEPAEGHRGGAGHAAYYAARSDAVELPHDGPGQRP